MTKYKEILITHVTNLDKNLQKVATALATTTDFEKDKVDILVQLGLLCKFNSDFGDMLVNDAPKEVITKFVQKSPEDIYIAVVRENVNKAADKAADPLTELANQLDNFTAAARELIKAQ